MAPSADALANIAHSLQQTLDEASAREAACRPAENVSTAARHVERLRELAARRQGHVPPTDAIAQRVAITDDELQACEAELRDLAARTEALREKLAQWAAGAIR